MASLKLYSIPLYECTIIFLASVTCIKIVPIFLRRKQELRETVCVSPSGTMGQCGPGSLGGDMHRWRRACRGSVPVAIVLLDLWLSVDDPLSNQSFSQQLNERMYVSGFQKVVPIKTTWMSY